MSAASQCASLFNAAEQNSIDAVVDLLSSTKERVAFIKCIKSTIFHKNHARRLFSALAPLLENVIENEEYVPASAFDDEERRSSELSGTSNGNHPNRTNSSGRGRGSEVSQAVITPDEESTTALHFMKYTAMLIQAYITNVISRRANNVTSGNRAYEILGEVWNITDALHESLFDLNSCGFEGIAVQRSIVLLCETYWNGHFVERDQFVTSLIPLLVLKTLDGNATKADIKRLWNVKDALFLLDFGKEDISYLRSLLLRTVSSPLYIKNIEGRKMLSFLFQLDPNLVKDLHQSIKSQIPMAKRSDLEVYGDIYLRSWKESCEANKEGYEEDEEHNKDNDDSSTNSGSIQSAIEENALQDLMFASVHVVSPHMAASLRTILEPLHSQKKSPEIEKLLFKMYTPFIWRSLSAANPIVRVHACSIFSKIFPLRDPSAGKIHVKEVNNKSVEALLNLLNDDNHKVRVAGCDATIRILAFYWNALSSKDIRSLLNQIVTRHASDATSSAVRVQAVKGITQLLDAEASHGVLRQLLPLLGDLIHDRVEKVRLVTVKLLLKLKKMKGFKYYHTVPSKHLLSQLAMEGEGVKDPTGSVASALTELLSNSYCPQGVKGSEQMRRTLTFLDGNPKAARVFYSNIGYQLEIRSSSKLIVMLLKTLKLCVDRDATDKKARKKKRRRNAEEDVEEDSNVMTASSTGLMSEIAQTIKLLLGSISDDLDCAENEGCLDFVQDSMQEAGIMELCEHFESKLDNKSGDEADEMMTSDCHNICASLLSCAGFMTANKREDLCSQLSQRLAAYAKMPREERKRVNVIPYLAVFCSWQMHVDLAKSMSVSIKSTFVGDDGSGDIGDYSPVLSSGRRGKRKKSNASSKKKNSVPVIPALPGDLCVHLIRNILRGRDPSSLVIRDAIMSSEDASTEIANALEQATIRAEWIINGSATSFSDHDIELIISACESFGRLSIHKEASKTECLTLGPQGITLLKWLTKRAIPSIISKTKNCNTCSPLFRDLNLSRISSIGIRESVSPTPLSPLGVAPPRRRSNLNGTPSKVDSSFANMESHGGRQFVLGGDDTKGPHSAQVMVISLLKSAFAIFSEWVALGGSGVDEITSHIITWKNLFQDDLSGVNAKLELFPSYCRFSSIVANQYSNFDLLKDTILMSEEFDNSSGVEKCMKDAVSFLLSTKSTKDAKISGLVKVLINIVVNHNEEIDNEEDWNTFVEHQPIGVRIMLQALISSGTGIVSLADLLSKHLVQKSGDPTSSRLERVLLLLCNEYQQGVMNDQLKKCILQNIQDDKNTCSTGIRKYLGECY